jgi:hypothetical protein
VSATRVVDADVVLPAAQALRDAGSVLAEVAADVLGTGASATAAAGEFAGELQDGAAVLSLSWSAAVQQGGESATIVAGVAANAVALAQEQDRAAAADLRSSGPR